MRPGTYHPSCPLWPLPSNPDADDDMAFQLASILSGREDGLLLLSGDMAPLLSSQPLAGAITEAEWNLSDDALIGHIHRLYRDAGATCALTHTAGCASCQLEPLGLAPLWREASAHAVRAARSCAPRFVFGLVDAGPGTPSHAEYESLAQQALQLERERVHAILLCAPGAAQAAALTREVVRLVRIPVVAEVAFHQCGGAAQTEDGLTAIATFDLLAEAGAFGVGALLRCDEVAHLCAGLCEKAGRAGRGLVVRLIPATLPETCGAPSQDNPPLAAAIRALKQGGVRVLGLGRGFSLADTALAATLWEADAG